MPLTPERLTALIKDEWDAMVEYTTLASTDPEFLQLAKDEFSHYSFLLTLKSRLHL